MTFPKTLQIILWAAILNFLMLIYLIVDLNYVKKIHLDSQAIIKQNQKTLNKSN